MTVAAIDLTSIVGNTGGFVIHGVDASDQSGAAVAFAGDVNGDGFDDLIIGAPQADAGSNAKSSAGDSYVVFGKSGGFGTIELSAVAAGTGGFAILGQDTGDYAGTSVSAAGDLNGDGFADLIIGAHQGDSISNGRARAGDSFVVFGKSGGFGTVNLASPGTAGFQIAGHEAGDYAGISVASAGDINGDGFDDLIIGAYGADGAGNAEGGAGGAYVVFGKASGFALTDLSAVAAGTGGFVIHGQDGYDFAGRAVSSAGDINGDGLDDLLIGAPYGDGPANNESDAGAAYVVFGRTSAFGAIDLGALGTAGFVIHGAEAGDFTGASVATAGDINGDGFADLIVGAPSSTGAGGAASGESYVVFGKSGGFGTIDLAGLAATAGFVIRGVDGSDNSGISVAAAGDVNADGFDDLIIGAWSADSLANGRSNAGDSYVVFGKSGGFGSTLNLSAIAAGTGGFVIFGEGADDRSGGSVAGAGDLNGDGFDDLVVGALNADAAGNARSNAGGSYVIFGRDFEGIVTHAGTTAGETLTGTVGVNRMVGGLGADTLIGNGGADVLVGGAGDDILHVSDLGFARVAGGGGTDTLALAGAGLTLNLAGIANTRLQDIERIDLAGSGNNTLQLSAQEVLNLSSTSNTLRVLGNPGDRVTFTGSGWVRGATAGGFTTWTNGQAVVEAALAVSPQAAIDLASPGTAGFVVHGGASEDRLGTSVASAGDINGDGLDDFVLGAPRANGPGGARPDAGAAHVVFGRTGGFGAALDAGSLGTAGFTIHGASTTDYAGFAVSSAGDMNGDGLADLAIGANHSNGFTGQSFVVFGASAGLGTIDLAALGTAGFAIRGADGGDQSGASMASAGDVNGDGFDDLVIGARQGGAYANGKSFSGEAYVVFGRAGGFGAAIELSDVANGSGGFAIWGEDAGDFAGGSVASAGDLNGDGLDDLVIGAMYARGPANNETGAGATYVVFGRSEGFGSALDLGDVAGGNGGFVIHGADATDGAGQSVASAGDVNGDGFADIVIGAPTSVFGGGSVGEAIVVFGAAGGFGTIDLAALGTRGFVLRGHNGLDRAGISVASAGDVNADGLDDLIVGANQGDASGNAKTDAGEAYLVFGRADGFAAAVDLSTIAAGTGGFAIWGEEAGDLAGSAVASAGDVDGDGFDDLILGAPTADGAANGRSNAGAGHVILGRDFLGTVTHAGTTAGETLTGTGAADTMVGGLGNDTLEGNGGTDVLIGGAGDDILRVSDLAFARAVGGGGTDTLALDGDGITLDLAAIADTRLQDIERIDLTGTGNNTLQLTALEVLNLSPTSNTLRVLGDSRDRVVFGDTGWSRGATAGGFTTWSNGQAVLELAAAVATGVFVIELGDIAAGSGGFAIRGHLVDDRAGDSVASAGDIDGDGFDDLLIGAPGGDMEIDGDPIVFVSTPAGYVVFGSAFGFAEPVELSDIAVGTGGFAIAGEQFRDEAGASVGSAGDFNGDGFADMIVGAPSNAGAGPNAGAAFIVFGQAGGFGATLNLATLGTGGFAIRGVDPADRAGRSVASAGDINGDGFDDVILGAYYGDAQGNLKGYAGEAYVVFGRAGGSGEIDLAALGTGGFAIWGRSDGDFAGRSVASAGDLNGDGLDDLLIGAYGSDGALGARESSGATYVVFGRTDGFGTAIDLGAVAAGTGGFAIHGANAYDMAGMSVSSAGDMNGDGFADLIVGVPLGDGESGSQAGDTYVVFGKSGGFGAVDLAALGTGGFVIRGRDDDDESGRSVASAGDVNGDGFDDLLIGAPEAYGAGNAGVDTGEAYVVFGTSAPFGGTVYLSDIAAGAGGMVIHGEDSYDLSGAAVSAAGDVDGDGFDDILIGAPGHDGGNYYTPRLGRTYVIFGRDFGDDVTHRASPFGQTLTGSGFPDVMVGHRQADVLENIGLEDAATGGAGDDLLRVSALTFARVMGGSGIDTLALDGAGIELDLAAIADTKLQDIERIDLGGTGANTLRLTKLEVLNLSSTTNTLRVLGDADDSVAFDDAGWVQGANAGGVTAWSNGRAVVEIADGVIPCFAPGTRIATPFGQRAVETLRTGDAVLTADGEAHPLTWVGNWATDAADPAHRAVRIRAHAFGPGRPMRDLVVSPSHALWLEGVMVPAVALVDGVRVVREAAPVRYHHIALARHAAVLAEDLPAETFCPLGDGRYPDAPEVADPLPRLEEGAALEALRARLGLGPRAGAAPAGFLERVLAVPGGIVVEGWASEPGGQAELLLGVGPVLVPVVANRWRIDLDRAGLPAAGFRCFVAGSPQGGVRVLRRATGEALAALG